MQHLSEVYLQESQELTSCARVPQSDHPIVPVRLNSLAKFLAGSRVIIRNASPDAHKNTPSKAAALARPQHGFEQIYSQLSFFQVVRGSSLWHLKASEKSQSLCTG